MYERFFKLSAEPFRLSPDHRFCYKHQRYAKARAYLAYAFRRAEGFVMITGRPGTGKTTLILDLMESLAKENARIANLVSTQLAADDLLRMVAFAFGLSAESAEKSTLLHQLSSLFLSLRNEGQRALLIVDEAQDLDADAMEELRLLTNLQQDGQPLLQIFLLGQPELRDLIHSPSMEQVHQRIVAASHLETLDAQETREYVEHRLRKVGWQQDPAISVPVFAIIHRFSQGVPRRINQICSRLLLHCFVERGHQVTVATARAVVAELQEEQLTTGNILHDDVFLAEDEFEPFPETETETEIEPEPEPEPEILPEPDPEPAQDREPELVLELESERERQGGSEWALKYTGDPLPWHPKPRRKTFSLGRIIAWTIVAFALLAGAHAAMELVGAPPWL